MPYLVVENGNLRGKRVEVSEGSRVVLGRDPRADIPVEDILCSREHFTVENRGGSYYLQDLGGGNGTHVDDEKVAEVLLNSGDSVHAGSTQLTFLDEKSEARQGLVGKEIAGYRIIERIGRGGMGTVYKALQVSLNRVVALKILATRYGSDPAFIKQFKKEAQAAGRLNHPNIVQVYDVGSEGGLHCYSMEFIESGSAQDLVNRDGALDPELALSIITDAARGLEYAEKKRLVHRDIKPDNLMINAEGIVKIADLGLAHDAREITGHEDSDDDQGIFGTPHFISPEQAQGRAVDTRSDIYSLGATFCLLLTGKAPYQGKTVREIVKAQISQPPPDLRGDGRVPANIAQIVERSMQKDPADRYASAAELVVDLERIDQQIQSGGSKKGLMIGVGALAVVAVAVAAFALGGNDGDNGAPPPKPPPTGKTPEQLAEERRQREEAETKLRVQKAETELARVQLEEQRLQERTVPALEALKESYRTKVLSLLQLSRDAESRPAKEVASTIARLDGEITRLKNAAEQARIRQQKAADDARKAATAALQAADAAAKKDHFAQAQEVLNAALASEALEGRPEAQDVRARRDGLQELAGARADELLRHSSALIDKDDFTGATDLLRGAATAFSTDCAPEKVSKELHAIVKSLRDEVVRIGAAKKRKRAADLAADQTQGFPARQKALDALRKSLDPAPARAALEKLAATLKTPEWKALVQRDLADVSAAEAARKLACDALKRKIGGKIELPSSRGKPLEWRLTSLEGDALTGQRGAIKRRFDLKRDFSSSDFCTWILRPHVPADASNAATLVSTLVLLGKPDEALQILEAHEVPAELRKRVEHEQAAQNEIVAIRQLEGRGATDPKVGLDLKRRLEEFLRRYRDTLAFLLNSNGSTPLVKEASDQN